MNGNIAIFVDLIIAALLVLALVQGARQGFVQALTRIAVVVAALLLGHYRTGTQNRLVTVGVDGQQLASQELDAEVTSLSAAGRYVALLTTDHVSIYDKQLLPVASLDEVSQAREVLMRSDGSAVLAGSTTASLYLP